MAKKLMLTPLYLLIALISVSCSKFVSISENLNSDLLNQDHQNSNTRHEINSSCRINQISSTKISFGSAVNYAIDFAGDFKAFDVSCDMGVSYEIGLQNQNSPMFSSISGLTVGLHTCVVIGHLEIGTISCTDSIHVSVEDSFATEAPVVRTPTPTLTSPPSNFQDNQFIDLLPQFRDLMNPASSLQLLQVGDNYYRFQIVDNGQIGKKLKFFVPPGTVQIASNLLVVSAAKAVWKLNSPPGTLAQNLTGEILFNYGQTLLGELQTGRELLFSTENPGMLPFDTGSGGISKPLDSGSYVYIDLSYSSWPTFTTTVVIEKKCYDQWYRSSSTKWIDGNPDSSTDHKCHN